MTLTLDLIEFSFFDLNVDLGNYDWQINTNTSDQMLIFAFRILST